MSDKGGRNHWSVIIGTVDSFEMWQTNRIIGKGKLEVKGDSLGDLT